MKAYSSSGPSENCSPVSSNCVIWQGPDIPCINICKGDTVSDIVYKTAVEICEIKESLNLSDLDFTCLLDICNCCKTPPDPDIKSVLQYLIDKICCIYNGGTNPNPTPGGDCCYEEPILNLPGCLQYNDPTTGLPVTKLVLSQFALRTAQKLCEINSTVVLHTSQISSLNTRVTALETAPCCYTPPTVTPTCVLPAVPTQMNTVLAALESQFCSLVSVMGSNTQLSQAAAQQCPNLNLLPALSQAGTMSGLASWNNVVSNFAQSMQNLWITVCDMRAAIEDLKNCCAVDCSAFILGFTAIETDPSRENLTLTFNSLTTIPSGFSNCPSLSKIKVTDGINTYTLSSFDLVTNAPLPGGYSFTIAPSGLLNSSLPHIVTVEGCVTKDGETCDKTVSVTIAPPTTSTSTTTTTTTSSVPIAEIEVRYRDLGGGLEIEVDVVSGTTIDDLDFEGTAQGYSNINCGTLTGAPGNFNGANSAYLPAGNGSVNSPILQPVGSATTTKVTTLSVNSISITTNPQTITVGPNTYKIIGFNDCWTLP